MKTKNTNTQTVKSGLQSRPEQVSTAQNKPETKAEAKPLPYVNYQLRDENRTMPTDQVLVALKQLMPTQYALAEVVGQWVWIAFAEQPVAEIRAGLSQLGFHWNNARRCWQHPCGQFRTQGSGEDPRQRYGSHMAAA